MRNIQVRICLLFQVAAVLLGMQSIHAQVTVSPPEADKGELNLREIDLHRAGSVPLNGEWLFYWNELLFPEDISLSPPAYIRVPSLWNSFEHQGEPIGNYGFATYRLKIRLKEAYPLLAMQITVPRTAAKVYVNGELIQEIGQVSKSLEGAVAYRDVPVVLFENHREELEVLIQVSNHHDRSGGLTQELVIGLPDVLLQEQRSSLALDTILGGCILIMTLYHIGLYILRRKDPIPLYFAIFCAIIFLRVFITGKMWIHVLQINWPWEVAYKLDIFSLFVLMPSFLLFTTGIFPKEVPKWTIRVLVIACFIGAFITLATNSRVYTSLVTVVQILILLTGVTVIYAIVKALRNKVRGAGIYAMGWVILFAIATNDMLFDNGVIQTGFYVHFGMLAFIFSQAFLLSDRFTFALNNNEVLTSQLNDINKHLEATVKERTESLEDARDELEQRNKKITGSINVAQRIQQSMLPQEKYIKKHLPESFFMWKPRDIVSGDFYWFHHLDDEVQGPISVVIVADCTGHGVPGAFMSMSGIAFINHILSANKILRPDLALKELNKQVRHAMKQDSEDQGASQDGMDISMCTIYHRDKKIEFAGAKSHLVYIKGGELTHIKGTRKSIGGVEKGVDRQYELHEIDFRGEELCFYLSSDGLQDQFGGRPVKKFMGKKFRQLLKALYRLPMQEQQRELEECIYNWMETGNQEQIDDMLVVGVRLQG